MVTEQKFYTNNGNGRAMSLYGARFSQGSEIVRDYIPCYRKSDGTVFLYETVSRTFLSNAGGTFDLGPDVPWNT